LPARAADEFHRKVRTLAGNFQLLTLLPRALVPWQNPIWVQFLSHKILRLVVPWALALMLVSSAMLTGWAYQAACGVQALFYLTGLLGIASRHAAKIRAVSAASAFLILNAAAAIALWVCVSGRTAQSWQKVHYPRGSTFDSGRLNPI
jgi:hypothetical protein